MEFSLPLFANILIANAIRINAALPQTFDFRSVILLFSIEEQLISIMTITFF